MSNEVPDFKPSDYIRSSLPANPEQGFSNFSKSTANSENKKLLWVGRISHVDAENMRCSVNMVTSPTVFHNVIIPAPGGAGPRSFAGLLPERGSMVVIGWTKYGEEIEKPVIVDYIMGGVYPARNYNTVSTMGLDQLQAALEEMPELEYDPEIFTEPIRVKFKKVYGGDFLAQSSRGADLTLDRDVHLVNRSGNEVRLRDSDQTLLVNVVNEYVSNAAGYYHRGLIKRSALSFQQELYPIVEATDVDEPWDIPDSYYYSRKIPSDPNDPDYSPAYKTLYNFGLIDAAGSKTFSQSQGIEEYPYVVLPDGIHTNYVYQGDPSEAWTAASDMYVEDRRELRHTSKGIMAVTEETDGMNIDLDPESQAGVERYIEDVHGTVVGNDFTNSGRAYYKRVMYMRLFSRDQKTPIQSGPTYGYFGTDVNDQKIVDDQALARLYKIQSPTTSNQYVFGINKQGKVYLHIPAMSRGKDDERGTSVDANILGAVKAIIGKSPTTGLSMDLSLEGGLTTRIGRGAGPRTNDGKNPGTDSWNAEFQGPVRWTFKGDQGTQNPSATLVIQTLGSESKATSGSSTEIIGSSKITVCGGQNVTEAESLVTSGGTGGIKSKSIGPAGYTFLGNCDYNHGKSVSISMATGRTATTVAGTDSTTVLAGDLTSKVVAGNYSNDVLTGAISTKVVTGNMTMSCITGNMSATVGAGNLSLSCTGGPVSMTSGAATTITSAGTQSFAAPITKIGLITAGFAVVGIPGPPIPARDYITGLPLIGVGTVTVG